MKLRMIAALAMLPVGLACSSTSSTAPTLSSYVGTYTLTKIDGTALPTTMSQNGGTINVTAGTAQIMANGTWSATLTATTVATPPAQADVNVGGTFTVSHGTATLTNTSDNTTNTATLSNNVLTVSDNSGSSTVFTFSKD